MPKHNSKTLDDVMVEVYRAIYAALESRLPVIDTELRNDAISILDEMAIKLQALDSQFLPRLSRFEVLVIKFEVFSEGLHLKFSVRVYYKPSPQTSNRTHLDKWG